MNRVCTVCVCPQNGLLVVTFKAPITTAADDIHNFFHSFSEKIRLDVLSEAEDSHEKIKHYFLQKIKVKN